MAESTTWTLYAEKMREHIDQLGVKEVDQLDGLDLGPAREFKTEQGHGSYRAYSADKVEKIGIGTLCVGQEVHYGFCTIFPAEGYSLPIFISLWQERKKEVHFLVDVMPTVDTLMDEEFRAAYVESLQPLWEKFANLPGICPEENDEIRSLCSIVYTAAQVPIEKEGMRLAALAPHTEYLKGYLSFLNDVRPVESEAKQKEVTRKREAIRKTLRKEFGGLVKGPLGEAMGDAAQKLMVAIFF